MSSKTKTRPRQTRPRQLHRPALIRPELFFPSLDVANREELFSTLAGTLATLGVAQHGEALCDALLERERLGTTAVGHETALPHARSMVVGETAVAFARPRRAIDWAAPDGRAVRLVFLIVAPYGPAGAAYLPLIASIARAVQDEATRARLIELESFEEMRSILQPTLRTA